MLIDVMWSLTQMEGHYDKCLVRYWSLIGIKWAVQDIKYRTSAIMLLGSLIILQVCVGSDSSSSVNR